MGKWFRWEMMSLTSGAKRRALKPKQTEEGKYHSLMFLTDSGPSESLLSRLYELLCLEYFWERRVVYWMLSVENTGCDCSD